jgi:hypothetical protein
MSNRRRQGVVWRDFMDDGMGEAEAAERALDLAFGVVEDSPYRCG